MHRNETGRKATERPFVQVAAWFVLLSATVLNACRPELPLDQEMQRTLEMGIRKYDIHGVSAAVVFSNDSAWKGVAGLSHGSVAMTPDMVFAIGSVTKNMIAALTLKLDETGVLALDDPVSVWIPPHPHLNGVITVRQLLGHTSGLYMYWDNQQIWDDLLEDKSRMWTPEEVLAYLKEPYFAPGNGFHYSNTNYLFLAMIIQKATGSPLVTQLRSRLWEPAGIDDIWLAVQEQIGGPLAHV